MLECLLLFSDVYERLLPPLKKQKSVSSQEAETQKSKPSAPPKPSAQTPSVLELLQKGPSTKTITVPPTSSEDHVSGSLPVAPEAIVDCK